jgi:hypothetical protein
MVTGQTAALGRAHAGQTVTVLVVGITLAIELGDGDTRVIRRITTQPVPSIKGQRLRARLDRRQAAGPGHDGAIGVSARQLMSYTVSAYRGRTGRSTGSMGRISERELVC